MTRHQVFTALNWGMPNENPKAFLDMSLRENRLDLVKRYNDALGAPGPVVKCVQAECVNGLMNPVTQPDFVAECEFLIESREGQHPSGDRSDISARLPDISSD